MVDASSMVSRLYHFGLIPVYSLGVATVSARPAGKQTDQNRYKVHMLEHICPWILQSYK